MRRAQRKINIFDDPQKRRIATSIMTHPEEVQLLRDRIMALEHALKLSNIKAEGYEVMMDILKAEYGIDLSKKVEAGQSKISKAPPGIPRQFKVSHPILLHNLDAISTTLTILPANVSVTSFTASPSFSPFSEFSFLSI